MSHEEYVKREIAQIMRVRHDMIMCSDRLIDDIGMDSLHSVELSFSLEKQYKIEIPYDDFEKVKTVKDVITYLEGKLDGKG